MPQEKGREKENQPPPSSQQPAGARHSSAEEKPAAGASPVPDITLIEDIQPPAPEFPAEPDAGVPYTGQVRVRQVYPATPAVEEAAKRIRRPGDKLPRRGLGTLLSAALGSIFRRKADRPSSSEAITTTAVMADTAGQHFPVEAEVPVGWQAGDRILDTYEVGGILGTGGMSKVYKVRHLGWDVDLAVKSPRPEILAQVGVAENFVREAETWVNLGRHPHIVGCIYVRTLGNIPRVFAEYVEGGSLRDWIEQGRLYEGGKEQALERIFDVAIQMAWGLAYAHGQGLVHRDVKPANVMMMLDGTAKVTDFGLARARPIEEAETLDDASTTVWVTRGGMSILYCSPEQYAGHHLTLRTDIWSWAVSVLEMFVGEVAWAAGQVAAYALTNYLETGSKYPAIPAMPTPLVELLKRCFQKDPARRPATMEEVAACLQDVYLQEIGYPYSRQRPEAAELLADSLNNQALSLLDLSRPAEAELAWQRALQIEPNHPASTYNLGLQQWRSARITDEQLIQQMKAVCAAHPGEWLPIYLLAMVHMERGACDAVVHLLENIDQHDMIREEVQSALEMAKDLYVKSRRLLRTFHGHTAAVQSAGLSRDRYYALSGSADKTIKLWDLASGRCLRTLQGHAGRVSSVCLSADGHYALSASRDEVLTPKLWKLSSGRYPHVLRGHREGATAVCLSEDGNLALSGGTDGMLRLWDVSAVLNAGVGEEMDPCLATIWAHKESVNSVYLSTDTQFALSGSDDRTLKLWDLANGHCLRTFRGHSAKVTSVLLSADGGFALSGSDDKTLKLWDIETGHCLQTFRGHRGPVTSVCLSAGGHYTLSGSSDQTLRLWETKSGRCLCTFQGHTGGVESVSFGLEGRFALSGGQDRTLKLWHVGMDDSPQLPMRISRWLGDQVVFPAQTVLAQAREALHVGDNVAAVQYLRAVRSQPGYRRHLEALTAWSQLYVRLSRKSFMDGWEWATLEGHTDAVLSVYLSANGRHVLSGDAAGSLMLWDISPTPVQNGAEGSSLGRASWHCRRTFEGHTGRATSVCLSMDGYYALSGSDDKTLKLWEVESGRCLHTFQGHSDGVTSVGIIAGGRFALSGSADNTLKVWDISTVLALSKDRGEHGGAASDRCLRTFKGHTGQVTAMCLSADGRLALSGSADHTLKLWEIESGRCLRTFKRHADWVTAVCLSWDGRFALSGSADKMLKLWEVESGRCLCTFGGHTDAVLSVCLSADGRFALSGSADSTLKLWGAESGRCLRTFQGHRGATTAACLSGDGRFALSGSADHTLKLWLLDWELEDNLPTDWNEGARPHLNMFVTAHTPFADSLPPDRQPTEEEVTLALSRQGQPSWNEDDVEQLLHTLGCAGYGWVRPGGVQRELERVAREVKLTRFSPPAVYTYALGQAREARQAGDHVTAARYLRIARTQPGYQHAAEATAEWGTLYLSLARSFLRDGLDWLTLEGHTGGVTSVYLSVDGRLALSGSADKTIKLWDTNSERCLRTFEGHAEQVNSVCLSIDGRHALSGSADDTLKLWEVESGRCLRTFPGHTGQVTAGCLSQDGRFVLSGSRDHTLRLWDVVHDRCLRVLEGHSGEVTSACLSADGSFALSGSTDRTLKLWDLVSGRCVRTLRRHTGPVTSVCLSVEGRFALSGSADKTLRLWDVVSGRCLRTFKGHTEAVSCICLSADVRFAFSQGADKTLKLWDVANGFCLRTFEGQTRQALSMGLSLDGRYILFGNEDHTLKLWLLDWELESNLPVDWDEQAGPLLKVFLNTHTPHAGTLPPDRQPTEQELALAFAREGLPIWIEDDFQQLLHTLGCAGLGWLRPEGVRRELERMIQEARRIQPSPRLIYAYALERARKVLAAGDALSAARFLRIARAQPGYESASEALSEWGRLYLSLSHKSFRGGWEGLDLEGHTGDVTSVCLSADGHYVLSGSEDKTLRLWNIASMLDAGAKRGHGLHTFVGHAWAVTSVCLSADGRLALSGSEDATLKLWDISGALALSREEGLDTGVPTSLPSSPAKLSRAGRGLNGEPRPDAGEETDLCLRTLEGHTNWVLSVCLSTDGRFALSGSADKTLKLWEVETGRCLRTFQGHTDQVTAVCLSPNGRFALSGSADKTLKLWDIVSGHCLYTFKGHKDRVTSLCLDVNGRLALSGSTDKTLSLWDVVSGRCLRTFQGHTESVFSVKLSLDGHYAVSGSNDATIKLWEVQSGRCIHTFSGHTWGVNSVHLSADGRFALSGSYRTIKLWLLDWELEYNLSADWDEGAHPYLEAFLSAHTPHVGILPADRVPTEKELAMAFTPWGIPVWTEDDFQKLLYTLGCAGYGWLRPEGIQRELERRVENWEGPAPL